MKICFLASARSPHTQRWARHFSEQGHDVHLISFHPVSIPGVQVYALFLLWPVKEVTYMLALPKIKWLLHKIRPDILHAHFATSYGFLGALTGYHPFVITAWGSDVLISPKQSRLMRRVVLFALRRSDLVTSMAPHMTRTLVEMGVAEEKILTLPFGVDTNAFHAPHSNDRPRPVDVICTRYFEPIYNIQLLLRALPQVIAHHPQLQCALVGDGSLRGELQRLARDLSVESNIRWVGRATSQEVADWLGRTKVFVTPSLSDGNNVSLNEAMACGCFPIATDIPANREWLVDGENGFLVSTERPGELAERILQGLRSEALRCQAAERNWQIVKTRADWNKNMALMTHYYERLAQESA
jgi:L-malate glycosyltransferase